MTHAVAFGRVDVIQWLRERAMVLEEDNDDLIAKQLVSIIVNTFPPPVFGVDEVSLIVICDLMICSTHWFRRQQTLPAGVASTQEKILYDANRY